MSEVGKVIRAMRQDRGLTLDDVADAISSHAPHLSVIENGRVEPTVPMLRKLAGVFGVPITAFFEADLTTSLESTREAA